MSSKINNQKSEDIDHASNGIIQPEEESEEVSPERKEEIVMRTEIHTEVPDTA